LHIGQGPDGEKLAVASLLDRRSSRVSVLGVKAGLGFNIGLSIFGNY
jgi:hypothetical protein